MSLIDKKKNDGMFCYPAVSWFDIIIGSINGKLPLYDALAIIANHFSFPDFSTRELYFFFCIALVIGVDSTPAAIPIIQTYPNIWVDLRKGFNEPNTFLSRQPKAQEMLGKVPDWYIMPTFFPGIIMMARYGDEYYFTHMDEIMTIASRSSPAIQSSRGC